MYVPAYAGAVNAGGRAPAAPRRAPAAGVERLSLLHVRPHKAARAAPAAAGPFPVRGMNPEAVQGERPAEAPRILRTEPAFRARARILLLQGRGAANPASPGSASPGGASFSTVFGATQVGGLLAHTGLRRAQRPGEGKVQVLV